jgi:undecaprenyl phosphate N,N'-diacetylbacillosamine 1-phosphate transferase
MGRLYKMIGKRILDIGIAFSVVVVSLPLLLLLLVGLYILTRENPLFIQKRPGIHQSLFNLYKVKTMYSKNSHQLISFCLFLRKYSLDELPQFVNVLLGDMSVVGPRPLLAEYLPLYNPSQLRRHDVRPGITGWAQIRGRNALPWPERFALDVWYIDHLSFSLDIKILWVTVRALFFPENVREEGLKEHEKFRGNLPSTESTIPEKIRPQEV